MEIRASIFTVFRQWKRTKTRALKNYVSRITHRVIAVLHLPPQQALVDSERPLRLRLEVAYSVILLQLQQVHSVQPAVAFLGQLPLRPLEQRQHHWVALGKLLGVLYLDKHQLLVLPLEPQPRRLDPLHPHQAVYLAHQLRLDYLAALRHRHLLEHQRPLVFSEVLQLRQQALVVVCLAALLHHQHSAPRYRVDFLEHLHRLQVVYLDRRRLRHLLVRRLNLEHRHHRSLGLPLLQRLVRLLHLLGTIRHNSNNFSSKCSLFKSKPFFLLLL